MDVVVVGSCNTDLITYTDRFPQPGETLIGKRFVKGNGGKGSNQCVVAARLGAKTAMIAKVGKDTFGLDFTSSLAADNVNIDHVTVTEEAATGVANIIVDSKGENQIIVVSGANDVLSKDDVTHNTPMIAQARVLLCQLEIQYDVTLAALKLARQHGVTTILNPAPAASTLDSEFYKHADIFCPNETEAELLTGVKITDLTSAGKAVAVLRAKGAQTVIITWGERGSILAEAGQELAHIPAEKTTAVDTTGAGDAFLGALAYFISKHNSLPLSEKVKRAGTIATISVQKPGTQSSYPYRKDVSCDLFD